MNKKINLLVLAGVLGLVGFLAFGVVMYTQAMSAESGYRETGQGSTMAERQYHGNNSTTAERPYDGQNAHGAEISGVPASSSALTQAEVDAILYMREEEKLARDVYNALYEKWGIPVFQNIAASEQTHMDAVKGLLDTYGLSDPASTTAGVFTNPTLQELYDQLVAKGSLSTADAMLVGGAIEEIDIQDLQERLAETTHADVAQVFNNLLSGSINHLSAFSGQYQSITGTSYVPQYLSAEEYQSLSTAAVQPGGQSQGYRGGRGR